MGNAASRNQSHERNVASLTHNQRMRELYDCRCITAAKLEIARKPIKLIQRKLREKLRNPEDDPPIMYEQLLRTILKETDQYAHITLWYKFDELHLTSTFAVASGANQMVGVAVEATNEQSGVIGRERAHNEMRDLLNNKLFNSGAAQVSSPAPRNTTRFGAFVPYVKPLVVFYSATLATTTASTPVTSTSGFAHPHSQVDNAAARLPPTLRTTSVPLRPGV